MHRLIQDHLEEVLSDPDLPADHPVSLHLRMCAACRNLVARMREQNALFEAFRVSEDLDPQPGFYARVLDRIDIQRPVSIWAGFFESMFATRLAVVSLAMALIMGVFLITTEPGTGQSLFQAGVPSGGTILETHPVVASGTDFNPPVFFSQATSMAQSGTPGRGDVLMSLVTYRGR